MYLLCAAKLVGSYTPWAFKFFIWQNKNVRILNSAFRIRCVFLFHFWLLPTCKIFGSISEAGYVFELPSSFALELVEFWNVAILIHFCIHQPTGVGFYVLALYLTLWSVLRTESGIHSPGEETGKKGYYGRIWREVGNGERSGCSSKGIGGG